MISNGVEEKKHMDRVRKLKRRAAITLYLDRNMLYNGKTMPVVSIFSARGITDVTKPLAF